MSIIFANSLLSFLSNTDFLLTISSNNTLSFIINGGLLFSFAGSNFLSAIFYGFLSTIINYDFLMMEKYKFESA